MTDALRWLALAAAALAVLMLVAIMWPAHADETRYSSEGYWNRTYHDYVRERTAERHRPHRVRPQVKAWRQHHHHKPAPPTPPPPPSNHMAQCLGEIRAHGTPHVTEAAAMDSAKRHWQAISRYDHGEKYMSIDTARHVKFRCARAETNETAAGRMAEAISGEAWRMRCEVVAHPCRSELKEAP
ncbi:MAG: hypothetical protein RLZZ227_1098 [Pseudomonadota bacterium]|jgi:hypothetical protein